MRLNTYEAQVWGEHLRLASRESSQDLRLSGFPTIPGLLKAAVSQQITSPGLAVPWYAVFGNHDTLWNGVIPIDTEVRGLAIGHRKASEGPLANTYLRGMGMDSSVFTSFTDQIWTQLNRNSNLVDVTADGKRKLFEQIGFMSTHLASPATPGPVGHGFTQANIDSATTYWQADLDKNFRIFGPDTCNLTVGADGAVPQDQIRLAGGRTAQAQQEKKFALRSQPPQQRHVGKRCGTGDRWHPHSR